jgi:anti-sigma factor RsiW
MREATVSDDELHAYMDGALDSMRRLEIASYLAEHPLEAARAEAFRAQREGLRALFDHVLDQPVPQGHLGLVRDRLRRVTLRRCVLMLSAIAVAALLVLGGRPLADRLPLLYNILATAPDGHQEPAPSTRPALGPGARETARGVTRVV